MKCRLQLQEPFCTFPHLRLLYKRRDKKDLETRTKMAGENKDTVSINLDTYRLLIQSFLESHQYASALFWTDKVVSLSNGDVQDVFLLAQCLYLSKQYHRAAHCLTSRNLHTIYPACKYLAAKCHYESKEYQEALTILGGGGGGGLLVSPVNPKCKKNVLISVIEGKTCTLRKVESSIKLLKGKIYEAMDNQSLAAESFKEALIEDVYCYEAFDSLVHHQMLSADEEQELLKMLPFDKQCMKSEAELLEFFYTNKLKKYSKPCERNLPLQIECLSNNLDVIISNAERHYYNCNYRDCFILTTKVLERDPYHSECLPIHIACLVELRKSNSLFYLAHKLVDLYPDGALAWFAVGCYYLLVGKNDPARRYLSKATTLDRVFGPAWLAYGHSFAVENEHDQAMAAYFKAAKLMKGCHLPLLYIGLEYGLTNNSKLAEKFFSQALTIAPEDPFVLHEMGVIAFQNHDYETAKKYFTDALERAQASHHTIMAEKWEPLLNNLGHVYRKLKKYDEALEFHQRAFILSPQNPSTFTAIGYVYALTGESALAVENFHKALGLRRDDTFSTTMLGNVIEQLMNEVPPYEGDQDDVPSFEIPGSVAHHQATETSSLEGPSLYDNSSVLEIEMEITD